MGYRELWGEVVPLDTRLLHPEGWTVSLGLTQLLNFLHVSSKSYTLGPCFSKHAEPCKRNLPEEEADV